MGKCWLLTCLGCLLSTTAGASSGECQADSSSSHGNSLLQSRASSLVRRNMETPVADYGHPAWLSNCDMIYLDVGTNKGVQIRKVFESHKYPAAPLLPLLDRIFGSEADRPARVCALGMEPNPHQHPRLEALEEAYNARGFRTHIYPFAAWKEEGTMHFQTEQKSFGVHEELGARIENTNEAANRYGAHEKAEVVAVRAVDLADFIRSLPQGRLKLMKLDIEGAEYETLAHALPQHIMCDQMVPETFIEAHGDRGSVETWQAPRTFAAIESRVKSHVCPEGQSPTTILSLDDETYLHDVDDNFIGV